MAATPDPAKTPDKDLPDWKSRFCVLAKVNPIDPLAVCKAVEKALGTEITPSQYDKLTEVDWKAACEKLTAQADQDRAGASQSGTLGV